MPAPEGSGIQAAGAVAMVLQFGEPVAQAILPQPKPAGSPFPRWIVVTATLILVTVALTLRRAKRPSGGSRNTYGFDR